MPTRALAATALLLAATALPAVAPGAARAAVAVDSDQLASGTNGIAAAPDGTFWVAQQFAGNVLHVSAAGKPIGAAVPVGGDPSDVVAAENGSIWVSVPSAQKLVRLQGPGPSVLDVSTGSCQPVALAAAAGRVFFSIPQSTGGCTGGSLNSVAQDGSGLGTPQAGFGEVYDLAVGGGKLFAPDFSADQVRRAPLAATMPVETTISVPAGSGPDGITVAGGSVWTTLFNSGKLATFPAAQNGGSAAVVTPTVPLGSPFGITASQHGTVYVASSGTHAVVDVAPSGAASATALPGDSAPWQLAPTSDGVLVTDQSRTRLSRVADGAPTLGAPAVTMQSAVTAALRVPLDTHGNPTTVTVEYGRTTGYGSSATAAPQAASAGGPATVTLSASGLEPGKSYHLRVRAQNVRGQAVSADLTIKAPKAPRATYVAQVHGRRTTLTALTVTGLVGTASATVVCKSKALGCPFVTKSVRGKKGKAAFGRFFARHPLLAGASVAVQVSVEGYRIARLRLTIRDGRPPKAVRK